MPRYLIEVPHDNEKEACERAVRALMSTGSHFLTNADWGCLDGVHKAWVTVEMEDKEEARPILPPAFRQKAKIIRLENFSMQDIDEVFEQHEG